MESDATPTGSDYVRAALDAEGVETLYGLIGEGNAHLLDACGDAFVYARHEQAAVTMAAAHARLTGEVGVVTLTHGPGVTNGATGLAIADRDGVPLVLLVGDTARVGRETSLQYLDHATFTKPVSAYQTRVETPNGIPVALRRAFKEARVRRGPAIVELPTDVQETTGPEEPYRPASTSSGRIHPDPSVLDEAVRVLDEADTPAILAGGGAMAADAGDALAALADRIGAPVATTLFGKGVLPESHPLVSGVAGTFLTPANEGLLAETDALLAVGARLSGKTTRYGALFDEAAVVQVDVSPANLGTHQDPNVGVLGDARVVAEALADETTPRPERAERVEMTIAKAGLRPVVDATPPDGFVDPRTLTATISDRLPAGTPVTVDSGNNTGFPAIYHAVESGRLLVNGNFGSMGFALPAAVGAAVVHDGPVVSFTGDGAMLMVIQEVETAVRYDLPVLVVVLNDASYGIIRHRQELEFGRSTAAEYDSPGFAEVARGFGADAATVTDDDSLDRAIDDFLADPRPYVLDARTDPAVARPGFPPY